MKHYSVNPHAESVANDVAIAVLGVFIFIAAALFIGGVVALNEWDAIIIGAILFVVSVLVAIVGVICWTSIKITVNMSRTLYNIENAIRETSSTRIEKEKREQNHEPVFEPVSYICPDCGQKVSENLEACPNCGCPMGMIKKIATKK